MITTILIAILIINTATLILTLYQFKSKESIKTDDPIKPLPQASKSKGTTSKPSVILMTEDRDDYLRDKARQLDEARV